MNLDLSINERINTVDKFIKVIDNNYNKYKDKEYDYNDYITALLLTIINDIEENLVNIANMSENIPEIFTSKLNEAFIIAIKLGPEETKDDIKTKLTIITEYRRLNKNIFDIRDYILENINSDYGSNHMYDISLERPNITDVKDLIRVLEEKEKSMDGGRGNRRNKATPKSKAKPKHDDMTMKDIKELCKANQIKLSRVVEGKRVAYKKKELITKLKRKKLL